MKLDVEISRNRRYYKHYYSIEDNFSEEINSKRVLYNYYTRTQEVIVLNVKYGGLFDDLSLINPNGMVLKKLHPPTAN